MGGTSKCYDLDEELTEGEDHGGKHHRPCIEKGDSYECGAVTYGKWNSGIHHECTLTDNEKK